MGMDKNTTTAQVRMQCKSKAHRQLLPVPAGHVIENGTYVRPAGSYLREDRVTCQQPTPCTDRGARYYMQAVTLKVRVTDSACGEKCQTATSPKCECSCKGENHGGR